MSDARIHRKFYDHPKVKKAGLAAVGLWTVANAFSRDHRTGGFLKYEDAKFFDPSEDLIHKLVEVRLWIPVQGGYRFNDWQVWNSDDVPKGAVGALIDKVIPRDHPQQTRVQLQRQSDMLVEEGTDLVTLEGALRMWLMKPKAGASLLPFLVSDVLRERAEDDLGAMLQEALDSGDISKLARKGMIYTPPDDEPHGLTIEQMRAHNLKNKRAWVATKIEELKHEAH